MRRSKLLVATTAINTKYSLVKRDELPATRTRGDQHQTHRNNKWATKTPPAPRGSLLEFSLQNTSTPPNAQRRPTPCGASRVPAAVAVSTTKALFGRPKLAPCIDQSTAHGEPSTFSLFSSTTRNNSHLPPRMVIGLRCRPRWVYLMGKICLKNMQPLPLQKKKSTAVNRRLHNIDIPEKERRMIRRRRRTFYTRRKKIQSLHTRYRSVPRCIDKLRRKQGNLISQRSNCCWTRIRAPQ